MTNVQSAIVWQAAYNPFGKAGVDGSIVNNFRFPGQYYDPESGMHYNWNRYYDPGTGRYLTSDPIGIKKGKNHLYVYVKNNPLSFIDILGLETATGTTVPFTPGKPCQICNDKEIAKCTGKALLKATIGDPSDPLPGAACIACLITFTPLGGGAAAVCIGPCGAPYGPAMFDIIDCINDNCIEGKIDCHGQCK
jgi:RHS repeat-associated protein